MENDLKIDEKLVEELRGLLAEGFNNFINVYIRDFEKKEKELINAIETKDNDIIKRVAHALKGSSLSVGAIGLGRACEAIENAQKNGSFEEVVVQCQNLRSLFPRYRTKYLQFTTM